MIYFLYGPDTYRSRKKLNEIISRYQEIHKSGLNFFKLDLTDANFEDFRNKIETVSIFAEKKLIVLENFFLNKNFQKEFPGWARKHDLENDGDRIVVIFEKDLEEFKDQDFLKELKKISKNQEFNFLGETQLKKWVLNWLKERHFSIEASAFRKLTLFVGPDLWQMENELRKLVAYARRQTADNGQQIIEKDVDLLVKPKIESNIFEAIDALSLKNKKRAIRLFHKILERGENELYVLSMIIYALRNLIRIKSAQDKVSYRDLPKVLKLHPYIVKKSYQPANFFSFEELKKIYEKLLKIDIDIKRGRIEPCVALDMLILGL